MKGEKVGPEVIADPGLMLSWKDRLVLRFIVWHAKRTARKLTKLREDKSMDKPMVQSKTAWGAVIAGVGAICTLIGHATQSGAPIPWGELLPQIMAVAGAVVAAIGMRQAVGR